MAFPQIAKLLNRRPRGIRGWLDGINGGVVYGWAVNLSNPGEEVKVTFFHEGVQIGELIAREFREDLRQAKVGLGHGGYGFYFPVPEQVRALRNYTLRAYANGKKELPGSPMEIHETPEMPLSKRGNHVRDFLAQQYLHGSGLEIGALNAPCKVPQGTKVMQVDSKSTEDLIQYYTRELHGKEVMRVDLVTDAHTLAGIESGSQDFVIANQVLEHLENPLRALESMLRVVKPGGVVFLSLPDKRHTWDAERPVTPYEHILDDYRGGPERMREAHYREWIELVEKVPSDQFVARLHFLMNVLQYPIHFHVWSQFEMFEMFHRAREVLPYPYEVDCFKANDHEALFVLKRL